MFLGSALRRAPAWICLAGLAVVTLSGCGGGDTKIEVASVSGKVSFKDQGVAEGTIVFENPTLGTNASGTIKNGAYEVPNAPVGKCKVTVNPLAIPSSDPTKGPTVAEAADIPSKYHSVTTSDLTADVKSGKNTADFTLSE